MSTTDSDISILKAEQEHRLGKCSFDPDECKWCKAEEESDKSLNGRRAEFVYEAARMAAIAAGAPVVPVRWIERERAFKDQFLEVIERQCGPQRSMSPVELHGSWMQAYFAMGWVYRDKDAVFVALCEIARNFICEEEEEEDG